MSDLEKKLKAIRRRLVLRRVVDWATWGVVCGLGVVALVLLVRVFFPFQADLLFLGISLVFGAMVMGAIAALFHGASLFEAALRADAHLGLHERLSSAWLLSREGRTPTPALQTLLEDARHHCSAIHPRRDFRCTIPRHGRHGVWPALGIVILLFIPSYPLLNQEGKKDKAAASERLPSTMTSEERANIAEEIRQLAREERERRLEMGDAELELELADRLERLARDLEMGNSDRLETMAELSRLNEEAQVKHRDADRERQPFRQLSGLQQANQTRELQRALKNGDFEKAAEQFGELVERLEQMPPEDLKELAEELEQLAQQLKDNPSMAEALEQAAEAIQQMAEQMQQQGQEGQEGSESGQQDGSSQTADGQASESSGQEGGQDSMMSSMPSSQSLAQAMESLSQARDRAENLEELSRRIDQLAQLQQGLSQCMGSCSGSNPGEGQWGSAGSGPGGLEPSYSERQGEFAEGDTHGFGSGSGGPGRGEGGAPPEDPSARVDFEDVFIAGDQHEGEIIAVFEGEGLVPAGESTLDYRDVPMEVRQRAARSIEDTRIPAGHRGTVRDYFEAIHFSTSQE